MSLSPISQTSYQSTCQSSSTWTSSWDGGVVPPPHISGLSRACCGCFNQQNKFCFKTFEKVTTTILRIIYLHESLLSPPTLAPFFTFLRSAPPSVCKDWIAHPDCKGAGSKPSADHPVPQPSHVLRGGVQEPTPLGDGVTPCWFRCLQHNKLCLLWRTGFWYQ